MGKKVKRDRVSGEAAYKPSMMRWKAMVPAINDYGNLGKLLNSLVPYFSHLANGQKCYTLCRLHLSYMQERPAWPWHV